MLAPQRLWNPIVPPFSLISGQAQPSHWHQEESRTDVHTCPGRGTHCLSNCLIWGVELEAHYEGKKKEAPEFAPLRGINKGALWTPSFSLL